MKIPFLDYILWIHWDPSKTAFTVPLINRPVTWYGILFVLGFFIAYTIFKNLLLSTILLEVADFQSKDIVSWEKLIIKLRQKSFFIREIFNHLPKLIRSKVLLWKEGSKIDKKMQSHLIRSLNDVINNDTVSLKFVLNELKKSKINKKFFSFPRVCKRLLIDKYFFGAIKTVEDISVMLADRLLCLSLIGTIIGARLGHVFLYDWDYYKEYPYDIIKIWEGGLASHGGILGMFVALFFLHRYIRKEDLDISFLKLIDLLVIPASFIAFCIRIGNFVNQEIVGKATKLFWAIIFEHSAEGLPAIPRHPVQLYEAFFYLFLFIFLYFLRKSQFRTEGILSGYFFTSLFTFRFCIEFLKVRQSCFIPEGHIFSMGQYLSIPFIILGIIFFFKRRKRFHGFSAIYYITDEYY